MEGLGNGIKWPFVKLSASDKETPQRYRKPTSGLNFRRYSEGLFFGLHLLLSVKCPF